MFTRRHAPGLRSRARALLTFCSRARGLASTSIVALLLDSASQANADQFIVADVAYTHEAATTEDSHYRITPIAGTPSNWTTPVNYAGGSAHVKLEVLSKPGNTPTKFQVCFEATPSEDSAPGTLMPDPMAATTSAGSCAVGLSPLMRSSFARGPEGALRTRVGSRGIWLSALLGLTLAVRRRRYLRRSE